MEEALLQNLPKVELHCHLDGSLTREVLSELLGREVLAEELTAKDRCRDLAEYLEKFDLPLQCLQTKEGLRRAGYDFIRTLAKEKVRYAEVRFAPLLSTQKNLNCEEVVGEVLEGLEKGRSDFGVRYNVIACMMRHHSREENERMFDEVKGFYDKGLCAFDLAGNEAAFPMENFMDLFRMVDQKGIPFTIHAGECGSAKNIFDSIDAGALRIGHGIAMRGQEELMDICRRREIGIEMCPVSNFQTGAIQRMEDYPMQEFLDHELLVTINTDNRTVSDTSLTKEIHLVQEQFHITDAQVKKMMENAIRVSFAGSDVKAELRKELEGSV